MRRGIALTLALVAATGAAAVLFWASRASAPRAAEVAGPRPAAAPTPPPGLATATPAAPGSTECAEPEVTGEMPAGRDPEEEASAEPPDETAHVQQGGMIFGTVRAPDGKPVAGASVWVQRRWTEATAGGEVGDEDDEDERILRYESDHEVRNMWATRGYSFRERPFVTTNAAGEFRVDGLDLGWEYEATAAAEGYADSLPVGGLRFPVGSVRCATTIALRGAGTVLVRLRSADGSRVPVEARVRVFPLPGSQPRLPASSDDPEGTWRFSDVPPGLFDAFAQAIGYRSSVRRGAVAEGGEVVVEIVLDTGAAVEGVVVDSGGTPLEGALVSVAAAAENEGVGRRNLTHAQDALTYDEGRFRASGLRPGPALLVAKWTDRDTGTVLGTRTPLPITAPSTAVRVALSRFGGLRMRLLTPGGEPYSGTVWTAVVGPSANRDRVGRRSDDGVVSEQGLDDGAYDWTVRPDRYARVHRHAEVRDGALVDLGDVTIEQGMRVSGRVVDGAGQPLEGAVVRCVEDDSRVARTDTSGRFAFDRVPTDHATLAVSREGFGETRIVVDPPRATGIEVRLARPATVRGIVKSGGALPSEGTVIELRYPGAVKRRHAARLPDGAFEEFEYYEGSQCLEVDERGRLYESTVPAGRWIGVWEDADGKEHVVGEWTFVAGETREIEIVLPTK